MAIEFRCPHTKKNFTSRQARVEARKEKMQVPANAQWKPVQDVRMGEYGIIELFDLESSYTLVQCPVCGDTRKVVTDKKVK